MTLSLPVPDELVELLAEKVREHLAQPQWRDLEGTARAFETDARQVRFWRERGAPAHKVGRKLWFNLSELDEWLSRQ